MAGYNGPDGNPAPLDGGKYAYGIDGYPDYQAPWTIEVDTVAWYNPNKCQYPSGPMSSICLGTFPPVAGLLQGESFHTIPDRLNGMYGYVGDGLAANHLGPYAQRKIWTVPNSHLGGESSVTFELDQRSFIAGRINAFTWSGELRSISFAAITVTGSSGFMNTEYTWDGEYEAYLDSGDYNFTITAWARAGQGFMALSVPVHLSEGQVASEQNFGPLERSNVSIPEFTGTTLVAVSALAAVLLSLRPRHP
jgi:hypothetical protein